MSVAVEVVGSAKQVIRGAIFDLDGTLCDSLSAITLVRSFTTRLSSDYRAPLLTELVNNVIAGLQPCAEDARLCVNPRI